MAIPGAQYAAFLAGSRHENRRSYVLHWDRRLRAGGNNQLGLDLQGRLQDFRRPRFRHPLALLASRLLPQARHSPTTPLSLSGCQHNFPIGHVPLLASLQVDRAWLRLVAVQSATGDSRNLLIVDDHFTVVNKGQHSTD
jgi:hypothetical protein